LTDAECDKHAAMGVGRASIRLPLIMATVAVMGLAVTVLGALWWAPHLGYRQPTLHVALETTEALVALVVAYLIVGRFARRRRLDDLLLAQALVLFALANLLFGAVPAAFGARPGALTTWAALTCRLAGVAALDGAAFAAARCVDTPWVRRTAALGPVAATGLATAVIAMLGPHLPAAVRVSPAISDRPHLVAHPVILAAQVSVMVMFALAAIGFLHRFRREGDELMGWLAVASVPAAVARLNYILVPSIYSEWVYLGDGFRLLFYVVILVAAAREIHAYWRAAADAAVLEERRRLARDLHDGLAQELAYIRRNVGRLDHENAVARRLDAAASRAIQESRRAMAALTEPLDRPLDEALSDVAHEVAGREGTHVALSLVPGVNVSPAVREALVRIASEAITNAARHGSADLVRIQLENGHRVRLRIADTGRGFDPAHARRDGFGLTSMRERAEGLGGRFSVRSRPGAGTQVEVIL
jgi:signal transduction histidine kinase